MDEMKKEVEETKNECDQKVESVIKKVRDFHWEHCLVMKVFL